MELNVEKTSDLAKNILDLIEKLDCQSLNEIIEYLGGATIMILEKVGDYIDVSYEEMRDLYIEAMQSATYEYED